MSRAMLSDSAALRRVLILAELRRRTRLRRRFHSCRLWKAL